MRTWTRLHTAVVTASKDALIVRYDKGLLLEADPDEVLCGG